MNICYIQALYNRSFTEKIIIELLHNHIKVIHYRYVTRYADIKDPELPDYSYFQNSNLRLRSPFFFKKRIQHSASTFTKWLSQLSERPQLIYAHFCFSDGYLAYKAYLKYRIPYVVAFRNEDMHAWYYWKMPIMRNFRNQILKHASKVVFINACYPERLFVRLPRNIRDEIRCKSKVIPNGIANFWHKNRIELRRVLNEEKRIRILTVGDINRNKNQKIVVDVVNFLFNKKIDISYTVVGKIQDASVAAYIKKFSNTKIISYAAKEQLLEIYDNADIFVMPSKHETFGITYIEAMSRGLPVIYSRGEGISGMFPEGYIGYGVDKNNTYDIANAIMLIIQNYSTISRHAIAVSRDFCWSRTTEELMTIFNNIIIN